MNLLMGPTFANNECSEAFSSRHEGGCHFLMADGAVRLADPAVDDKTTLAKDL